ncbi:NAD(P)/FAD-dependent oxidoreductase [Fulvimarina sp. MAC3]|uniref:flavin-containing monooxygenase n=1 Tax=Fulvimarina sp. MAC3 TaxID=3148887 RepID=UPI0031FC320F
MSETLERPRSEEKSEIRRKTEAWFADFEKTLAAGDAEAAASMFAATSFWRDLVTFTWNIKTVENPAGVKDMLLATLDRVRPKNFQLSDEPSEDGGVITAWFTFETDIARGEGLARLQDGKAWTFLTAMTELKGYEENRGKARPLGAVHGHDSDKLNMRQRIDQEKKTLGYETQPHVVIVGGGQGGIALGARLRQLGVPAIILERRDRPGDSWRNRYKSLCLHDPVWYDHLPYLKFPENWPVFAPKDKIGDWLEFYTRVMELNYWEKSEAVSAHYDEAKGEWVVEVNRNGESVTLRPKELVFATGMSGKANRPKLPGEEKFKGEVQHSSQHPGPDAYADKKVVVVGSNNSAFDICSALHDVGADVTMVQRSSTHIIQSDKLMEYGLGDLYSERAVESGVDTHKADMIFASLPYRILHQFQKPVYDKVKELDKDFYDGLEKAGFKLDWGDDGSGLFMKYLRRGSGYYIDIGAAQLIIDGKVKLASGQVKEFTETGIKLEDGTELPADLVVFATGYGSMNGWVEDLIDRDTALKIGKVWGLGSDTTKDPGPWEGEQRNMWKPTQVEHLWMHGGNLHQSRHYSLYLALQLKARYEGIPTPVYGLQEVHHPGI